MHVSVCMFDLMVRMFLEIMAFKKCVLVKLS